MDPVTFVTFQEMLMPKSSWKYKIDSIKGIPLQKHRKSCRPFCKKKNEYVVSHRKEKM